jgi:ABC-type multidrug transport system fused ATPase/permease subunit
MNFRPTKFQQYRQLLVTYLKPQWPQVLLLTLLLLGSIGLQLAGPQLLRYFIDTAQDPTKPLDLLFNAALIFLGIVITGQIVIAVATYFSAAVGWTATNSLREDLALHCLKLDLSFHKARTPGEMVERVDGDVTLLSNFFSEFVIRVLGNLLLLVGVLVVVMLEDWRLGLALVVYALIAMFVLKRIENVAVEAVQQQRQAFAEMTGFMGEQLNGLEDIRANGAGTYVMSRLYRLMRTLMQTGVKGQTLVRVFQSVADLLTALGYALVFTVGAYLLSNHALTIGTVYLVFSYAALVSLNLYAIAQQVEDLQKAAAGVERITELYYTTSSLTPTRSIFNGNVRAEKAAGIDSLIQASPYHSDTGSVEDALPSRLPDQGALHLELRGVSFGYQPDMPVLKNITFRLEAGQHLGLVGRTGSGKTTLSRLLFRFYDPQAGEVLLDGNDLRSLELPALRRRVGLVTQEVQLFGASVRDNLTFWDTSISDDLILETMTELGLSGWLASLLQGLDTVLAPGGSDLSAGEAQLLAFVRVFLQNPGLVILDEASSRLDPATERLIGQAVERLLNGRTGLIIAHRLRTLERVDQVMLLEAGQIVEYGPRTELALNPNSRYYHLLKTGLDLDNTGTGAGPGEGEGVLV